MCVFTSIGMFWSEKAYLVGGGLQVLDTAQQQVRSSLVFLQEVVVSSAASSRSTDQESEDTNSRRRCTNSRVRIAQKMYTKVWSLDGARLRARCQKSCVGCV